MFPIHPERDESRLHFVSDDADVEERGMHGRNEEARDLCFAVLARGRYAHGKVAEHVALINHSGDSRQYPGLVCRPGEGECPPAIHKGKEVTDLKNHPTQSGNAALQPGLFLCTDAEDN